MIKKTPPRFSAQNWRRFSATSAALCVGLIAASLQARPVPQNLAGGLEALVQSNLAVKSGAPKGALINGYATQQAANYADLAIQDPETNRFLVDIHPSGRDGVKAEQLAALLKLSTEVVERVVWEVVPALAEAIIRENLEALTKRS